MDDSSLIKQPFGVPPWRAGKPHITSFPSWRPFCRPAKTGAATSCLVGGWVLWSGWDRTIAKCSTYFLTLLKTTAGTSSPHSSGRFLCFKSKSSLSQFSECPNFIQISSKFHPNFIQISSKCWLSSFFSQVPQLFCPFPGDIADLSQLAAKPRSSRGKGLKRQWRHLAQLLRRLQNFATEGGLELQATTGDGDVTWAKNGELRGKSTKNRLISI